MCWKNCISFLRVRPAAPGARGFRRAGWSGIARHRKVLQSYTGQVFAGGSFEGLGILQIATKWGEMNKGDPAD